MLFALALHLHLAHRFHHLDEVFGDHVGIHRDHLDLADRDALLLLLAASLGTFILTRLYTRAARHRGWSGSHIGGVHVHHMVLGVVLVLASGMLNFALRLSEDGRDALAVIFGAGGAFILDEFALTFHLRDVYWTEEGRRSIDAGITWLLLGLLLLVGIFPVGIHDGTALAREVADGVIAVNIAFSLVTCLKGKLVFGLLSVFIPPVGLVTAIRLARPGSIWAQLAYPPGSAKLAVAEARFHPHGSRAERMRIRVVDTVAGAPTPTASSE